MTTVSPYRIGLDIGGTFTDLVLLHEPTGTLRWHKVLTTPRDPSEGALRGLDELCGHAGIRPADVGTLIHATTLVTNAIIERKGARAALLTTDGFRDILEMGKEQRYDIYDLFLRYPDPLVPRRWRLEVRERVTRDGDVRIPIDVDAVRPQIAALADEGVEAVAVVFLHAYKNAAHEEAVRELLAREFPHLFISVSSEVSPEIREYERTCTTVCNAYVQPVMDRYIRHIEAALTERGFGGRFLLMLSSGTLATPDVARRFPVRMLESGPAAGALVVGHLGRRIGRADLVGFDMGGTTAKICLVRDGRPKITSTLEVARVHRFKKGSGLPVVAPVVDMIEIGAGGGSVASVDAMGLLRVGPHSAGADPGPACYGFGGAEATVTDACVALGYFDPNAFLGGTMRLDVAAARAALSRVGASLGLDAVRTAWGIYSIVCENMAQAARLYLIERGQDPRRFALIGFGGAGPATAARVARLLGVQEVLIPPASGLASAIGLLAAPLGFDFGHSMTGALDELDWGAVERLFTEMEEQGRAMVAAAGGDPGRARCDRRVEMRYAGQFHDIEIPVPRPVDRDAVGVIRARFASEYDRLYGGTLPDYPIQALNWRVLVAGPSPDVDVRGSLATQPSLAAAQKPSRLMFVPDAGVVEAPVYERYLVPEGSTLQGPAILEEAEATTVLWPGDRLTVDQQRNLVIQVDARGAVPAAMRTSAAAPGEGE